MFDEDKNVAPPSLGGPTDLRKRTPTAFHLMLTDSTEHGSRL